VQQHLGGVWGKGGGANSSIVVTNCFGKKYFESLNFLKEIKHPV
jgi:hypothetical protein